MDFPYEPYPYDPYPYDPSEPYPYHPFYPYDPYEPYPYNHYYPYDSYLCDPYPMSPIPMIPSIHLIRTAFLKFARVHAHQGSGILDQAMRHIPLIKIHASASVTNPRAL